jgi:hypothetical protein
MAWTIKPCMNVPENEWPRGLSGFLPALAAL